MYAAMHNHVPVIAHLVSQGALVDQVSQDGEGMTAILGASLAGGREAVQALLQAGADPTLRIAFGGSCDALEIASLFGHVGVVDCLLTHFGRDLKEEQVSRGLMMAASSGHTEVMVLLMQAGADHTWSDSVGSTALSLAKSVDHQECVVLLEVRVGDYSLDPARDRGPGAAKARPLSACHTPFPAP